MKRDELVQRIRSVLKKHDLWPDAAHRADLVDDLADLLHEGPLHIVATGELNQGQPVFVPTDRLTRLEHTLGEMELRLRRLQELEGDTAARCDRVEQTAAQLGVVQAAHTEQIDSLSDQVDDVEKANRDRAQQLRALVEPKTSPRQQRPVELQTFGKVRPLEPACVHMPDFREPAEAACGLRTEVLKRLSHVVGDGSMVSCPDCIRLRGHEATLAPGAKPTTVCAFCGDALEGSVCPRCQKPGPPSPGTRGLRHG